MLPLTVILNTASGRNDKDSVCQQIEGELAAAGRTYRILKPEGKGDIDELIRRTVEEAKRDPQIIVAAGGDGTMNAVAAALVGTNITMGVVPLGTFNYFARNLGIPLEPAAAARALLDGYTRPVHVGRVNGRVFLINSSFGLYRRLQEEREQHKRRFGRNKIIAVISGFRTLMQHHRTYDVQLELDGKPVRIRTPMVLFGINPLQLENLDVPVAECAARGQLALLVLKPLGRLAMLGIALRGALHALGDAENLRMHCAGQVEVNWRGGRRMKVSIDGEAAEFALPLVFEALPNALTVLVPRDPEPRE